MVKAARRGVRPWTARITAVVWAVAGWEDIFALLILCVPLVVFCFFGEKIRSLELMMRGLFVCCQCIILVCFGVQDQPVIVLSSLYCRVWVSVDRIVG